MKARFWGVRGSIPTPGEHTRRWGGNTACIEVRHGDLPPLVFDCGTGARLLGEALCREPVRQIELMFSHLHMDHLFGLPFFAPLYTPSCRLRVTLPALSDTDARDRIGRYLDGTYHPVRLRDVPAEIAYAAIRPGTAFERSGWQLTTCALVHPGGSCGYRIDLDGQSLCYVTDTSPFARPGQGVTAGEEPTTAERRVLDFLDGADVVIYDTMHTFDEYLDKMSWGHSYPEYGVGLCEAAGVGQVVLFHHAPQATDEALDARDRAWAAHEGPARVITAREGETIDVARARVPGPSTVEAPNR